MAASLSSVETEELETAAVLEGEAGCMGLIFWLSGGWFKQVMFSS